MKIKKVHYKDENVLIAGVLIKRIFRKPVFVPFDNNCGFDSQIIFDESSIVPFEEKNNNKEHIQY